jgi:hypothetical protein
MLAMFLDYTINISPLFMCFPPTTEISPRVIKQVGSKVVITMKSPFELIELGN